MKTLYYTIQRGSKGEGMRAWPTRLAPGEKGVPQNFWSMYNLGYKAYVYHSQIRKDLERAFLMNELKIKTHLGQISVAIDEGTKENPIVYLHGVYLDKTLWKDICLSSKERTQVFVDMPAHGQSDNVGFDWTLDDCVLMLIQILDELKINRCVAVGHSWGSMTVLRAAVKHPHRFQALGLFNMPHRGVSGLSRLGFTFQKLLTIFPKFYGAQAAKSLYSKEILQKRPSLKLEMMERLAKRPSAEINRVIEAVLLQPENAHSLIRELKVPALAIVGEKDYVGSPPGIETVTVSGGHVSPHETEEESKEALKKLLEQVSK